MLRRIVAGLAAVVLVAEAALLVLVHLVLGLTTANQSMSIAGSDPELMSTATYAMGAGVGAFLLLCAVVLAVAAVRDRSPGRFGRVLLIVAAVLHALLGTLAVGLAGWPVWGALMLVLCLLVLCLLLYAGTAGTAGTARTDGDAPGARPRTPPGPVGEVRPTSP
ncbi:hypothetical protein AB0D46_22520 [Streptomyces sp. NPDC048383]|uniref:hypothetical protein n=1 Tax=Streptomyces sp. NPDC048383 TaxID=3155386 RepID=UPI003426FC15